MKSAEAARVVLATRYRRQEWRWLRAELASGNDTHDGTPDWPLRMALGAPDERRALADPDALRTWLDTWRTYAGPGTLVHTTRRWRALGRQTLPTHLVLDDPATLAHAFGQGQRWRRLLHRGRSLVRVAPERLDVIGALLTTLDTLDDADWSRWRDAADWLAAHPDSGLYPRQLPIAGIDTKTLERWRPSLERWLVGGPASDARSDEQTSVTPDPLTEPTLDIRPSAAFSTQFGATSNPPTDPARDVRPNAASGTAPDTVPDTASGTRSGSVFDMAPATALDTNVATEPTVGARDALGLRRPPIRVRALALDPILPGWPRGIGDMEVPIAEFAALPLRPARTLVVENLQSGLALPPLSGTLAIVGLGYALEPLTDIGWLAESPIDYWGDIDTHGLAMLARLRRRFGQTRSILMDETTLLVHRELWVEETRPPAAAALDGLEEPEAALYDDLRRGRWGIGVRLEQERIAWPRVLEALGTTIDERE